MLLGGTNIEEYNSGTIDRVVTIAKDAVAHASNLDASLGGDILYIPTTGALHNEHSDNVKVIIEARLRENFKNIIGA